MFTGIIQTLGHVRSRAGSRLSIGHNHRAWPDPIQIGESIAVNGVCLTVVRSEPDLEFDLSEETLSRTTLGDLREDAPVNFERALRACDRLGGHFVQGHVDAVGTMVSRRETESGEVFRFKVPDSGAKYLIDKGSIAIDGISLTVVQPEGAEFEVWVIPHTLAETNLHALKPGDRVNVEFDMLAKYVEKLTSP